MCLHLQSFQSKASDVFEWGKGGLIQSWVQTDFYLYTYLLLMSHLEWQARKRKQRLVPVGKPPTLSHVLVRAHIYNRVCWQLDFKGTVGLSGRSNLLASLVLNPLGPLYFTMWPLTSPDDSLLLLTIVLLKRTRFTCCLPAVFLVMYSVCFVCASRVALQHSRCCWGKQPSRRGGRAGMICFHGF